MANWSPLWRWGGAFYVASVIVLAFVTITEKSESSAPVVALLLLTLPVSIVQALPIYLVAGLFDPGLEGSPASDAAGIVGFAIAGVINLIVMRFLVQGAFAYSRASNRRDRAGTRGR